MAEKHVIERFALAAAPKWFQGLEWILILAAFQYFAHVSTSRLALIVPGLSFLLLYLYFSAVFFRFGLMSAALFPSKTWRIVSLLASGFLSVLFLMAAQLIASFAAAHTK